MNEFHPHSIDALMTIKEQAARKKKIVFVSGNFNIVHPGHLRLLRFAAENGDFLVVGVYPDSYGNAFILENLRLEAVKSTSWVDFAFILRDPPEKFIERLQPAIVVKGREHENSYNPESKAVSKYGGKILFSSGDIRFSSLELLQNEFGRDASPIVLPKDFSQHHGFSLSDLLGIIDKISKIKVIVIGETIVDEYITCDPLGMSQEDPTIVVAPVFNEKFIGGAGIVAAHGSCLGAQVEFFSVLGNDSTSGFVKEKMEEFGVKAFLFEDESRPTILKQRFRANGKTLLRVSHLRQQSLNRSIQEKLINELKSRLSDVNLIIFSDYNYGILPQPLVEEIVSMGEGKGIMMVADSQSSSQVGDVSRFKGMTLLTPTEREARLAVKDFDAGLVVLAEKLRKKAKAKNILLTLGAEGTLIHAATASPHEWLTDRLPAMNTSPKDSAGAGDSLLISSSLALAAGASIWQSAYLGTIAAACQVGRVGNIPLKSEDLKTVIQRESTSSIGRPGNQAKADN